MCTRSSSLATLVAGLALIYNQDEKMKLSGITVGELKECLEAFKDSDAVYIGGLTFYRFKKRGKDFISLEFNESVYEDAQGKIVIE